MYYILRVDEENIDIVGSNENKIHAMNVMKEFALEFIKDEEGNKRAQTAHIENDEALNKLRDGHYILTKERGTRLDVIRKTTYRGYLTTSVELTPVFHYLLKEYTHTAVPAPEATTTSTSRASAAYSAPAIQMAEHQFLFAEILNELRGRIMHRRGSVGSSDQDPASISDEFSLSDYEFDDTGDLSGDEELDLELGQDASASNLPYMSDSDSDDLPPLVDIDLPPLDIPQTYTQSYYGPYQEADVPLPDDYNADEEF